MREKKAIKAETKNTQNNEIHTVLNQFVIICIFVCLASQDLNGSDYKHHKSPYSAYRKCVRLGHKQAKYLSGNFTEKKRISHIANGNTMRKVFV